MMFAIHGHTRPTLFVAVVCMNDEIRLSLIRHDSNRGIWGMFLSMLKL